MKVKGRGPTCGPTRYSSRVQEGSAVQSDSWTKPHPKAEHIYLFYFRMVMLYSQFWITADYKSPAADPTDENFLIAI